MFQLPLWGYILFMIAVGVAIWGSAGMRESTAASGGVRRARHAGRRTMADALGHSGTWRFSDPPAAGQGSMRRIYG